jgi:hypothetical protein
LELVHSLQEMTPSVPRFLLIFSICAAWALISRAPIYKYLTHGKATAAMLLGILFISLGMHWLDRLNQQPRQISAGWLLLLFLIFTTAFTVLYPISLKHTLNSSDREGCSPHRTHCRPSPPIPLRCPYLQGQSPAPYPDPVASCTLFRARAHCLAEPPLARHLFRLHDSLLPPPGNRFLLRFFC